MNPKPRYKPGDKIGGCYQVHQALMGGMGEVDCYSHGTPRLLRDEEGLGTSSKDQDYGR